MRDLFERIIQILISLRNRIVEIEDGFIKVNDSLADGPYKLYRLHTADGKEYDVPVLDHEKKLYPNSLPLATTETSGAMSAEDKAKLDSISGFDLLPSRGTILIYSGNTNANGNLSVTLTIGATDPIPPLIALAYGKQLVSDSMMDTYSIIPLDYTITMYDYEPSNNSKTVTYSLSVKSKEPVEVNTYVTVYSNYQLSGGM